MPGVFPLGTVQAQELAPPRQHQTLNAGWRYPPGAIEGAEATAFADSAWTPVHLPHTWNPEDAFDEDDLSYRRGVGWYRRTLTVADSLGGATFSSILRGPTRSPTCK